MKTPFQFTLAALALTACDLSAGTHYVSLQSTNPTSPYTNWITAATNIQHAVDVAVAGDTVLVTNGVYAAWGRDGNRVSVTNAIRLESVNGPLVTTIDGGAIARCVYLGTNTVLSGFTLTNGYAGDSRGGGGVYCEPSGVVTNCVLNGNWARNEGGGAVGGTLYNCALTGNWTDGLGGGASGGTLYNCTLSGNSAPTGRWWVAGGGAYGCTLYNCTLTGNSAANGGGAAGGTLYNCTLTGNSASDPYNSWGSGGGASAGILTDCTLTGNSADRGGGASMSTLYNCAVVDNVATYGGAASYATLNNCTVVGNVAWDSGGGVMESVLANCVVAYNAAWVDPNYTASTLDYCCTSPLPTNGVGNIAVAPQFVDYVNGNLRLEANSPCINAGNNLSLTNYDPNWDVWFTNRFDLDNNARVVSGTVDIGAYEFQGLGSVISYAWLQHYGLPTDGSADATDPDADGHTTWQEWRCLTDPTNALSALRLLSASPTGTNVTVSWQSVAGVNYFLERSTNLWASPSFTLLYPNLPGQPGTTSFTDTNAASLSPSFYRVGVGN